MPLTHSPKVCVRPCSPPSYLYKGSSGAGKLLTGHVAVAAAGVAGLSGSTAAEAAAAETSRGTTETGTGAVASNVANLAALVRKVRNETSNSVTRGSLDGTNLVALGALAGAAAEGAVARDVAGLAALVASLVVLHGLGAVTACSASVSLAQMAVPYSDDLLM